MTMFDPTVQPQAQPMQAMPRKRPLPSVGGMPQTQAFSPQSNLIGQQINPTNSARTQAVGQQTNTAFQNAQNAQIRPFQAMTPINTTGTQASLAAGNAQMQGQTASGYQAVAPTNQTATRGYLTSAAQNVGPSGTLSGLAGMGATGSFGYAGDTTGVRGQAVGQLSKMLGAAPDRATLASNTLSRLRADTDASYQGDLRAVAQKAAAMGRRGSGLTTSDLGDVAQRRNEFLDRRAAELADNAASLTLEDERAKLAAAQGLSSELAGQDTAGGSLNLGYLNAANAERGNAFGRQRGLEADIFGRNLELASTENSLARQARGDAVDERGAMIDAELRGNEVLRSKAGANRQAGLDAYGIDSDQYGRARDERNAGLDYDQQNFTNKRSLFNDARSFEGELADRDFQGRQELRGERGYQYGLDRDALGDRRQQMLDEEDLFGRDWSRSRDLFGLGYGEDPSGAMAGTANYYGQQGQDAMGAASDLFGEWARGRATPGDTADLTREGQIAAANGYLESRNRPGLVQTPTGRPRAASRLPTPSF